MRRRQAATVPPPQRDGLDRSLKGDLKGRGHSTRRGKIVINHSDVNKSEPLIRDKVNQGPPLDLGDADCVTTLSEKKHISSQPFITLNPSHPYCLVSKASASVKTNLATPRSWPGSPGQ